MTETGITEDYARRAWEEYTADEIFPRDGRRQHRGGAGADRNQFADPAVPIASSLRPTNTSTATISTRRKAAGADVSGQGVKSMSQASIRAIDYGDRLQAGVLIRQVIRWRSPS